MSLIVDGVRSIRRKWFADKKLAHIRAIGVQSKTLIWDGFVFRVSWQDDLVSLRHIMAPMGVLVAASGASGITLCSAESWLGPFTTKRKLQGFKDFQPGIAGRRNAYEYAVERGDNTAAGEIEAWTSMQYSYPSPALMPTGLAEDVVFSSSVRTIEGPPLVESVVGLFESDCGSEVVSKVYYTSDIGSNLTTSSLFTLPGRWRYRAVRSHWSFYEYSPDTRAHRLCSAWEARNRGDLRMGVYLGSRLDALLPAVLVPVLYSGGLMTSGGMLGLGSYAFAPDADSMTTYVHALRFDLISGDYADFFKDELGNEIPENRKWKMLYFMTTFPAGPREETEYEFAEAFYDEDTPVVVVNAEQFLPLLDLMSGYKILSDGSGTLVEYTIDGVTHNAGGIPYDIEDDTIEVEWELAAAMLRNIFAWPNYCDMQIPHDNVMFHSATSIYSWTRRYGAVEIRSDGMFPADITMPPAVEETDGVRPVISHAGNGMFFCSCDQVGDQVLAVYRGTPFEEEGWEEIPLVTVGWANGEDEETGTSDDGKIMYVRPALVTEDRIVLLAITRDMLGVDSETGDPRPRYCFAYMDGNVGEDRPALLKLLAEIPITDEPKLRFDVTTYGNGEYTALLLNYPSPPPAVPQHGLLPYNDYPVVGA